MMRIGLLLGILAATLDAANAQEGSGNPEAGWAYVREVCSPWHAVTASRVRGELSPSRRIFTPSPTHPE